MGLVHLHEVLAVDVVIYRSQNELGQEGWVELTLEQIDILAAVDALQPVCNFVFVPVPANALAILVIADKGCLTYLTASGASYISENSDSVGEANTECSVRVLEPWFR
jgi:hypothetical protein